MENDGKSLFFHVFRQDLWGLETLFFRFPNLPEAGCTVHGLCLLLEYLTEMIKLDLLVIDDFGLMELDLDKCRNLFEVIDGRDGRKSTMIMSQFPVNK